MIVMLLSAAATAVADGSPPTYLAAALDRDGRLAEALPLYRARADATLTSADRLRYAGALLRAGEPDAAQTVYATLLAERGSVEHGDGEALRVATVASSILVQGFPALAADVLAPALATRPGNRTLALLLVRARIGAGDQATARAVLASLPRPALTAVPGERLELARAALLTGDGPSARRLLDIPIDESIGQMFRASILAEADLRAGAWKTTERTLASAARLAPASLAEGKVDRAWRNAQRELRALQLRRAVCLWRLGRRDAAADQAARAADADEESVRSSAIVLRAAVDLADGRRDVAMLRLAALAGHDVRFAAPLTRLEPALVAGVGSSDAVEPLAAALAAEDRAADTITTEVVAILAESIGAPVVAHP